MFFKSEKSGGAAWIVAFLGNPGAKYVNTRHNIGFITADYLAGEYNFKINKIKFRSLYAQVSLGGEKAIIMKPQTYMNLSGEAVREAADYYKIPPERCLVVFDDCALPCGKLRIRKSGSAGGHNGIKSLIARLGTEDFPRIKIGVGEKPHPDYDMVDWVLSEFSEQEKKLLRPAVISAAEAVEAILSSGLDAAMNKYN